MAETGMPPLAMVMVAVAILVRNPGYGGSVLGGAAFAASVLLSVHAILLAPAMLLLLRRTTEGRVRYRKALVPFLMAVAVPVVLAYVLAWRASGDASFLSWMTEHPSQKDLQHIHFGLSAILRNFAGMLRLLVDAGSLASVAKVVMQGGADVILAPLSIVRDVVATLLSSWLIVDIIRRRHQCSRSRHLLVVAFVPVFAFNALWLGSDPQFWLPLLPFLLLTLADTRRNPGWLMLVLPLAMGIMNVPIRERSLLVPGGDAAERTAYAMKRILREQDLILTPGSRWTSAVRSMGCPARVLLLNSAGVPGGAVPDLRLITDRIDSSLGVGGRVFVDNALGPRTLESIGPWEIVASAYHLSRDSLATSLRTRYWCDTLIVRETPPILVLEGARTERRTTTGIVERARMGGELAPH
jgi:hypothetical protein